MKIIAENHADCRALRSTGTPTPEVAAVIGYELHALYAALRTETPPDLAALAARIDRRDVSRAAP